MNTNELCGVQLAYWVAMACRPTDGDMPAKERQFKSFTTRTISVGASEAMPEVVGDECKAQVRGMQSVDVFEPHIELRQLGPLAARFEVDTEMIYEGDGAPVGFSPPWRAWVDKSRLGDRTHLQEGCNAFEAICRTIVHSVYGDEVPD